MSCSTGERWLPIGWFVGVVVVLGSLAPMRAVAQLTQPAGGVIPVGNALLDALNADGDSIVPLSDARTIPETFLPTCSLTFTVIARGAGYDNAFGWYNVTGAKPTPAELYPFIECTDGVGVAKALDLLDDPRYAGGEIGFFEATPEGKGTNCPNLADFAGTVGRVYYSETAYNDDNLPGLPSYIHLLTMDSKVRDSSFYFGWEDKFAGGDNDFDDLLIRVDGIACSGGGEDCDTGLFAHCALGATECVNGEISCVPRTPPREERCNAVDDDCDGQRDEGELCGVAEVCDQGNCVRACSDTEFPCPVGFTCRGDGLCIDERCIDVTCGEDEVCRAGTCEGACDGVQCPQGQECAGGACVDPCSDVECATGHVCYRGACVSCCSGCPNGLACDAAATTCTDSACVDMSCDAGNHCSAGTCVDDCSGVVCPSGEACDAGRCIAAEDDGSVETPVAPATPNPNASAMPASGAPAATDGADAVASAPVMSAPTPGSRRGATANEPGCSVVPVPAVGRTREGTAAWLVLAMCPLGWVLRRRRAGRQHAR